MFLLILRVFLNNKDFFSITDITKKNDNTITHSSVIVLFIAFSHFIILFFRMFSTCQTINLRRHVSGPIAVIYIHYCDPIGTGIDHCKKCR